VTAPPTRLDIQVGAADLIEELARVSGYDRLPSSRLAQELPEQRGNRSLELEEKVRDLLADAGLQECITYSLVGPTGNAEVALLNPISPERSVLRRSLIPGLLAVAAENLKNAPGVALFELGPVFLPKAGAQLPDEPRRLAIVLSGRRTDAAWDGKQDEKPPQYDFYDLKGVLEGLAADLHLPKVTFEPATDDPHTHPGRTARLLVNGQSVGLLGELHPKVAAACKLTDRPVLIAALDLEALLAAVPERFPYRPLSPFPPVLRDVAVVVTEDVPAERVVAELRAAGGELLEDVRLFDVYRGESIPAGTKSLAYALTYRVAARQLNDKEVDKAHEKIEGRLRHVLKAKIRGKDGV
jgi:phenylalanyl-tRNA synthetase beta chain